VIYRRLTQIKKYEMYRTRSIMTHT